MTFTSPFSRPVRRRTILAGAAAAALLGGSGAGGFVAGSASASAGVLTLTPAQGAALVIANRAVEPVRFGPGHPLAAFFAARDRWRTERVVIEGLGNSHMEGQLGKTAARTGWVGQLAAMLRATYPVGVGGGGGGGGGGGSIGHVPSRYQVTDAQVIDARWVFTGTVVKGTQHGLGRRSVPLLGAGTATMVSESGAAVAFDQVQVAWFATAVGDSIEVTVGSDAARTIVADSAGPKTFTSPHYGVVAARAVSVRRLAGAPELEGGWPFADDSAAGLHVLNGGQSGSIAASFAVGSGVAGASSSWIDSTLRYGPALRIRSFMTNDPNVQTAADYGRALQALVTLDRTKSPCPILLLGEFERQSMPAGRAWADYVAAARAVAAANTAVHFMNLGDYIPRLAGTGGYDPYRWLSADGIHLTAAGDTRVASVLAALLAATPA